MWQKQKNGDMTINIGVFTLTIHAGHYVHYLIARVAPGTHAIPLRSGSEENVTRAMASARREMRRVLENTFTDASRRECMTMRIQRLQDAPVRR